MCENPIMFDMGKAEISQYYLTHHKRIATTFGFPLFLAELDVSGIGKAEKLQYYLIPCRPLVTRLRTEKSKYHTHNSRHAAPLVAIRKYKSRKLSLTKYFITTLLV